MHTLAKYIANIIYLTKNLKTGKSNTKTVSLFWPTLYVYAMKTFYYYYYWCTTVRNGHVDDHQSNQSIKKH